MAIKKWRWPCGEVSVQKMAGFCGEVNDHQKSRGFCGVIDCHKNSGGFVVRRLSETLCGAVKTLFKMYPDDYAQPICFYGLVE